jgi:uncharacterized repeat protein (TIGR01451 family)
MTLLSLGRLPVLAVLAAGLASPLPGQVPSRVVAYSGLPAPGAPPLVFDNFNYLAIAPQGGIVFRGRLATGSNTYGIWRETSDPITPVLSLVEREGTPSPLPGYSFSGFPGPPTINLPERFAFKAHVTNGPTFPDSLWIEKPAPTGLTLIAREGAPAPGLAGVDFGILFSHAGYDPLLLDNGGRALFGGRLTGGGVTTANDASLWFYDGVATSLVAREGDPMPGVPAGHFFADTFQLSNSLQLGNGLFFFYGSDGHPTTPTSGLWFNPSGVVQPFILEGGNAAGLGSDETLTQISSFRTNNNNQIAFGGIIRKDDGINPVSFHQGVWISNSQGQLQLAARSDQSPPAFRVPSVTVFTDGGHAFGVDGVGRLGRVTTGGLTVIAKPGDPAPGTAAGVTFGAIDPAAIAGNASGQVAFAATLTGTGVHAGNDRGVWAQNDNFQLVKVAREGDTIDVPAGMPRTITAVEFGLATGSGQPRAMSDRGEVVWRANVAGLPHGSQVVLVTGVGVAPDPPRLRGIEVVQVIQNRLNEIRLIAGKKTAVRVHLDSPNPRRFRGQLRAFAGGVELPGSPIPSANPGHYLDIDSTSADLRHKFGRALHFEVPKAWTTGTVRFLVEWLNAGALACREAAGPVGEDCQATVTFQAADIPRVTFLGVRWVDGTADHQPGADLAKDVARRALLAYPTPFIEWDFRPSGLVFPFLPEVKDLLPVIDIIHAADGSPRRLYYGVIPSEKTVGVLGIAYLGRWAGIGHVPSDPKTVPGRHTATHELAHELRQPHAIHRSQGLDAEGRLRGACGEVATEEPPGVPIDFPNWFTLNGQPRPTLGPMDQGPNKLVYGLDTDLKKIADPNRVFDLMSYCRDGAFEYWPSNYRYNSLSFEVNVRFSSFTARKASIGDYFVVRGNVGLFDGTAALLPFATLPQTESPDAMPSGDYFLRLRNAGGALMSETAFAPADMDPVGPDPGIGSFLIGVPADPAIRRVEIVHGGMVIASRDASANAPVVQVTAPNGGEMFSGPTVTLNWTGNDADGDPLTYVVQYSPDNGTTWTTLGADLAATSVDVPRSSLPASAQGLLRVLATDGFLSTFDTSNGTFTVANNPPFVSIDDPDNGGLYVEDQLIFLNTLSFDPEDGNLGPSRLAWSSSINGPLGTGNDFSVRANTLSPGTHVITVTATDDNGAQDTDTTTIRVASVAAGPLADLSVDVSDAADPAPSGGSATYTIDVVHESSDAASAVTLTFTANLDPAGPSGPGPATIQSVLAPGWTCTTGSGTANCTRSALAGFEESTLTIQVAASQVGVLTATAQISTATEDPATGNDSSQETTAVELPPPASANVSVTKTHSPASPLVGHELTYTIIARNDGPDAATAVTVEDALPAQVGFVSAAASQGSCSGTSTVSCILGSLAPGAQASVTILVRPTATGMISNTATVSSDQPDPTPSNNTAIDLIGTVGSNGPFAFHTVTPCRVLDTRLPDGPLGGPSLGGPDRSFVLAGTCGIPATARAVSANITVTGPASQGHLSLYPAGFGLPLVSSINFRAGQTRANNVTLPLGTGGAITVQAALIGGTVHFILDVNGYYE